MYRTGKCLWRYFCLAGILLLTSCPQGVDNDVGNGGNQTKTFPPVQGSGDLGVWWWWVDPEDWDSRLDFAAENGVTEVYFETGEFDDGTGFFIESARNKGVKVFYLLGGYTYIWDHTLFAEEVDRFSAYQDSAPENRKFAGLHLDIEPHQHPDFDAGNMTFFQDFLDFAVWVCDTYKSAGISIDLDIPAWFNQEIDYRGEKRILHEALIIEADRIFVMSYRDNAEGIYETAREEIGFAKSLGKQIILCVETGRVDEEPGISFYGRPVSYFYGELEKLYNLVDYDNYGLSIHHISSWQAMEN